MNRRLVQLLLVCFILMGLALVIRDPRYAVPTSFFLPMHMVLELVSVVVSFAVFTTGWYGYKQTRNARDLLIAFTFLTVGTLDLIHTLSYQGMPDFLGAPGPGKAAGYWMMARIVVGVGLLAASLTRPPFRSKSLNVSVLGSVSAAVIVITAALATFTEPAFGRLFFRPETGLTTLKIGLEVFVILLYAVTIVSLTYVRGWEKKAVDMLRAALVVAILTELAFTLYTNPFALINGLGHVFKITSYYLILSALFVTAVQRPYNELSRAKEELQKLYQHAQEHREEIERSFARIGSALSSSLRLDEALDQISHLAVDMLHADCAIVASLEKTHSLVRVATQSEDCKTPMDTDKLTEATSELVLREKRTILINNTEHSDFAAVSSDDTGLRFRSMLCSPMILNDQVMGMVAVYAYSARVFDSGDMKLIEGFASHAAVAVQNAINYERESRIADVLQRSFLSATKVVTDRFEIAQVYEPAMTEALVGGDFYDVFEMTGGKIGLVIGDVSGKGLKAAVHTAMLKYTLRAYAAEGHSPAEAMRLLDQILASQTGPDTFVTMFYGVLDTETGELVYTNAGHEPPVHSENESFSTLQPTAPALGLGVRQAFAEGKITLGTGSTLLLYTDGISEARRGLDFLGVEGIGDELRTCGVTDSEDVAKCVHQAAIRHAGGELKDDAAILAVRAIK